MKAVEAVAVHEYRECDQLNASSQSLTNYGTLFLGIIGFGLCIVSMLTPNITSPRCRWKCEMRISIKIGGYLSSSSNGVASQSDNDSRFENEEQQSILCSNFRAE